MSTSKDSFTCCKDNVPPAHTRVLGINGQWGYSGFDASRAVGLWYGFHAALGMSCFS